MTSTEPTLNLTYDELLETTKTVLSTFIYAGSTPPEEFERGLCIGAIDLFLTLAQGINETDRDYLGDHRKLRLLAGLDTNNQEPFASAR